MEDVPVGITPPTINETSDCTNGNDNERRGAEPHEESFTSFNKLVILKMLMS